MEPYIPARGLYNPCFEHDGCGVGLICQLDGIKSHAIVADGLKILCNLSHRGAYGCDAATGDGAGILMQMPHDFLASAANQNGIRLPGVGDYACGAVFLPSGDSHLRQELMRMCEAVVLEEGQTFLGWRRVPVDSAVLGPMALAVEPVIYHLFIGRAMSLADGAAFERKLYVIRKVTEARARAMGLCGDGCNERFHIPSLSSRTLVYKGMFLAGQLAPYYPDLSDPAMASAFALVHQRYSTNTFPTWDLAHPFRFLCHNGEINTLRGNVNWMNARQHLFESDLFGKDLEKLFPIATPGASDSAILDNALELLYHSGRSLAHCIMMLIPEAWQNHRSMPAARRDFYEYHACLMEPWDGPAFIAFTDGIQVGAVLDRNGLRPARYTVTTDRRVIMGSETGVLEIAPRQVLSKGRLQPGRMFLIDLDQGRIVGDDEIKDNLAARRPYGKWLRKNRVRLCDLPAAAAPPALSVREQLVRQKALGYTQEDFKFILAPMALSTKEPTGSMGDDTPPAILSDQPRPLFDYFRQLFAQVTNPPIDAIREALVTSLATTVGSEADLFKETPRHCRQLSLEQPILSDAQLAVMRHNRSSGLRCVTLPALYLAAGGALALEAAMERLCHEALQAVELGAAILILSDRAMNRENAAIPSLLALAGVHHFLIRQGRRTRCALVVETGEAREVHHFCSLLGYGAGAVNPYLALAAVRQMAKKGHLALLLPDQAQDNYIQAAARGILKVMSKMGISTLHSYRGAQVFECVGLSQDVVQRYFCGTVSRIGGIGLAGIERNVLRCHAPAFASGNRPAAADGLFTAGLSAAGLSAAGLTSAMLAAAEFSAGGKYQWRRQGELHQYNPLTIARLQQAVRSGGQPVWDIYAELVNSQNRRGALIRGLLSFKAARLPVPLSEVEPWTEIVKRFKTGAMSYGSISKEAHETLAIAMNRIGGRSNSGEGGEDADRFKPDANGDWRNSAIKQVASGRFGVTAPYLVSAAELQIKMAQGAKPGEGGQLPGFKVYPWIAKTRHSTPYVTLISPPPHHDIYSIEDLAQLVFDLRNINPRARISVKLVSEAGVGTVAAGVVKAKADVVLISGESGGTGASPLTSIKYGGLAWEIGLAETHQTLVLNGLRHKIVVECDGGLKTGRDVAVACLLGADEFGFGTAALVALGCVMMRVCHLNTCPVGIATQDPELRKKFTGRPEYVINFMRFVAEELRGIMARLGFRSVAEMVGRSDCLDFSAALAMYRSKGIDLSPILHPAQAPLSIADHCSAPADTSLGDVADRGLIEQARPALEERRPVAIDLSINNTQRTLGTLLSSEVARRYGQDGLPEDTIVLRCRGSAGQSFFAFGMTGLTALVQGEANDYFGKGLSGAKLAIEPPPGSAFVPAQNIIIGNVAFYGATSGQAYIGGMAGERFCVRNSGVRAVVEAIGDHGCEYMTGGCVVVLGPTGRNFAAGMSGGTAYVLDADGRFAAERCNLEMVELEPVDTAEDRQMLQHMVRRHLHYTGSALARCLLADWGHTLPRFVKVMPLEYKKALERLKQGECGVMQKTRKEKSIHGQTDRV